MNNERGSIIIWLLIAMMLFAALSFIMMRGSRTSSALIGTEEAKAYASQLVSYGQELKSATRRLQLRGCGDSKVSFETAVSGHDYSNPTAPNDGTCDVFDPRGGGMTWFKPSLAMLDPAMESGNANFGTPFITGTAGVVGVGKDCANASCSELVLLIADIKQSICEEINIKASVYVTPPGTESITNYAPQSVPPQLFQGSYLWINAGSAIGNDVPSYAGKQFGCFRSETGATPFVFYQVLIAR